MTCNDDSGEGQSRNTGVWDPLHIFFTFLVSLVLLVNLQLLCGTAYLKGPLVRNRMLVLATAVVLLLVSLSLNVELSSLSPGESWSVVVFALMAMYIVVVAATSYPFLIHALRAAYINQQRPEERKRRNKSLSRIALLWKWTLIIFEFIGVLLYFIALTSGDLWPLKFIFAGAYMLGAIGGTLAFAALLDVRYFIFSQTRAHSTAHHNAWLEQLETNPEQEAAHQRFQVFRRNMTVSMCTMVLIIFLSLYNVLKLVVFSNPMCGKLRKSTTLDNSVDYLFYMCVNIGLEVVLTVWVYTANASLNACDLCFAHAKDPSTVCFFYCRLNPLIPDELDTNSEKNEGRDLTSQQLSNAPDFDFATQTQQTQREAAPTMETGRTLSPPPSVVSQFSMSTTKSSTFWTTVVLGKSFRGSSNASGMSTASAQLTQWKSVKVIIYGFDGVLSASDQKRFAAVPLKTVRKLRRDQMVAYFGGAERLRALNEHLQRVHETGCLMFVHTTDTCSDKILHVLNKLEISEPFVIREGDEKKMAKLLLADDRKRKASSDGSTLVRHRVLGGDHPALDGRALNVLILELVKGMGISHDEVLLVDRDLSLLDFVKRMHLCRTYHVPLEGLCEEDFEFIADRVL